MRTAILGFGVEGKAVADYLHKHDVHDITICDEKLSELPRQYRWCTKQFGKNAFKNLEIFERIFRSPGVVYMRPELAGVRSKLTSLTQYFFDHCPAPIIGVTGTKGKGTTSSLLYDMIHRWLSDERVNHKTPPLIKGKFPSRRVFLGGNIGTPPLEFLDTLTQNDVVVLELSSFQLQAITVSPHIAVVLGISDDHLDHHATLDEYYDAKRTILLHQKNTDYAIIDDDTPVSHGFIPLSKSRTYRVSLEKVQKKGAYVKMKSLLITDGATSTMLGTIDDVQVPGRHTIKNILMAATAAHVFGVPVEYIAASIKEWKGLPHRLQCICEKEGVAFYNDSASTNPATTIAALRSFTKPLILILGGSDKNLDFMPLANEIMSHPNVKRVILMGETRPRIEAALDTVSAGRIEPLEIIFAESYMEAFMVAKLTAEAGDIVLLSPGCASFDMFTDYQQRGEIFTKFMRE